MASANTTTNILASALAQYKSAFVHVAFFTAVVNILLLAGSIYMLQVYDRALPSRSVPTLVALTIILTFVYALMSYLDYLRQRILQHVAASIDAQLSPAVFEVVLASPLRSIVRGDAMGPVRDLDAIRQFLSSLGPTTIADLPWMPLYLLIMALFHPLLAAVTLAGAIVMFALNLTTELVTRKPLKNQAIAASYRGAWAEAARRNAQVIAAHGMQKAVVDQFQRVSADYLVASDSTSRVASALGSLSKGFRMLIQSIVLGVGAWLVLEDQASPGVMIAASIIASRALAPAELAIAHWKPFMAARQAWVRLNAIMSAMPPKQSSIALDPPSKLLSVRNLSVAPPGGDYLILNNISFDIRAGEALGVIGPSASGKSTLVRTLVAAWHPVRGEVRLDGAKLEQWSDAARGRFVGYLPQDIELFDGTVAENIARLQPDLDEQAVIDAAKNAGAHEMILRLANGYQTRMGDGGVALSGGQRQRIGLARALYGQPFLVILDEPNSNLDQDGEAALQRAILGVRARGGVVIIVAHKPSVIENVDLLLVIVDGHMRGFGPREEVLRTLAQPRPAAQAPPPSLQGKSSESLPPHGPAQSIASAS